MNWLYNNWYKSTLPLAILSLIIWLLVLSKMEYALALIWLQTIVYLFHQSEEYLIPGGFVAFFNKKLLNSKQAEFPLTKVDSFWINIPIIYLAFPFSAMMASLYDLSFGIWTAYFSIINAISHVGIFFKLGYNPGFIISLLFNIPIGLYTIYYTATHQIIDFKYQIIGFIIGLTIQASLMIYGFLILKPKSN